MADTDLIERVNVIAGLLVLSPEQSEALMEAATALAEKDARIAELEAELIQSRNFWSDELSAKNAQLTASRAECEGLRAEHSQRAGKLEVALRRMLTEHDILSGNYNDGSRIKPDRWPDAASAARAALHKDPVIHNFGAALSQKETGDGA